MEYFLGNFLLISDMKTVIFLLVGSICLYVLHVLSKRKVDFSKRVFVAMLFGVTLGFAMQVLAGFPDQPLELTFVKETTSWYGLLGNGFIDFIRMLVIPLVMVSIIHVILHMREDGNVKALVKHSIVTTMVMVGIAASVGLLLGMLFQLGGESTSYVAGGEIKEVVPVVTTFRNLIPANPIEAMVKNNIVGLVIFSAFFGLSARRMNKKNPDVIQPFYKGVDALHKIIISISLTIIKGMPYGVLALLANTIAQRGLDSIVEVMKFILVLYLACLVMFVIQCLLLLVWKVNPLIYIKKSFSVMVLAFTSRSSVGVLPATIETLTKRMGVSEGTASLVASFGTTAGMQGCAGIFPALLIIYVANSSGVPIDFSLFVMAVLVIVIGSVGIAGIPGTATMAASVGLSGVGMGASFAFITPILAIDPIIDMARTLLNVTGSLTNAIMVDRQLKLMDMDIFHDPTPVEIDTDL